MASTGDEDVATRVAAPRSPAAHASMMRPAAASGDGRGSVPTTAGAAVVVVGAAVVAVVGALVGTVVGDAACLPPPQAASPTRTAIVSWRVRPSPGANLRSPS